MEKLWLEIGEDCGPRKLPLTRMGTLATIGLRGYGLPLLSEEISFSSLFLINYKPSLTNLFDGTHRFLNLVLRTLVHL